MLTSFPPDYEDATKYTRSGNCEVYRNRGWCFCESSWAQLVKNSLIVWDLGKLRPNMTGVDSRDIKTLMSSRIPPVLPDNFKEQLERKGFTNGSTDRPLVAGLYRDAFEQRFARAEELSFAGVEWGDTEAQALAEVLSSGAAPRLRELKLGYNSAFECYWKWRGQNQNSNQPKNQQSRKNERSVQNCISTFCLLLHNQFISAKDIIESSLLDQ